MPAKLEDSWDGDFYFLLWFSKLLYDCGFRTYKSRLLTKETDMAPNLGLAPVCIARQCSIGHV